jgi:hypothetical protein
LASIVISDITSDLKYPFSLAINLFEMSNNHIYFAKHLSRLIEISIEKNEVDGVKNMLNYFVDRLLSYTFHIID